MFLRNKPNWSVQNVEMELEQERGAGISREHRDPCKYPKVHLFSLWVTPFIGSKQQTKQ